MKTRNRKQTKTVIITLSITAIIVTALIITAMFFIMKPKSVDLADKNQGGSNQGETTQSKFYENGWDSSVVAEIKEGEVPVPVGFEYVSGQKDTGLIIKNTETGKQYVWVPYQESYEDKENATATTTEEYFKEKTNTTISADRLAEIQKYGGFYAGIEYITYAPDEDNIVETYKQDDLETYSIAEMSAEQYEQTKQKLASEVADSVSVNGSLAGREELNMMMEFSDSQKNNSISMEALGAQKITPITNGKTVYAQHNSIAYYGEPPLVDGAPYRSEKIAGDEPLVITGHGTINDGPLKVVPYVQFLRYDGTQLNILMSKLSLEPTTNTGWKYEKKNRLRYTNENAAIYEETSEKTKVLKSVAIGESVTLYKTASLNGITWAYIKDGDVKGYIPYSKLSKTSIWEKIEGDTTRYTNAECYLYMSPRKKERERTGICKVPEGASLKVVKKATIDGVEWAYATYGKKSGYILTSFLTTNKPETNTNKPTTKPTDPIKPQTNTNQNVTNNVSTEEPTEEQEENTKPETIPAYTGEVITVKPGENKIEEQEVPDEWKNYVAKVVNGVPVPKGFEVAEYYGTDEKTGFVIKQTSSKESENTHRLCYVWIPVNKNGNTIETLADAKNALNEIYKKAGANTITSESATEALPEELVQSIKEYGGFYMAQGELGYDNNAKLYNRPRGMRIYDNGYYGVDLGNYFRYIEDSLRNTSEPVNYIAATASYNNITAGMSMDKINQVCEMLSTDSVTSHLTYGAEWDAAMLWILKQDGATNEDLQSLLIKDSTSIGKYKTSMTNSKLMNDLWGLGGNLSEITQEKVENKIVVRGGSYSSLGSEQPIASRTAIEEKEIEKSTEHGFRNCLYINPSTKKVERDSELKQLIDSEKTVTETKVTVKDADGASITIPQGFKPTKDAYEIDQGVVIENDQGNQFVWIPVTKIDEMYSEKEETGKLYNITKDGSSLKVVTSLNDKFFEPGIITGADKKSFDAKAENLKTVDAKSVESFERQIKKEYLAMIESVKANGGFYIARYETGDTNTNRAISKKDSKNRTGLNWYEAYQNNKTIQTGNYAIPGMIYGSQWDAALRWLQACDKTNQSLNHIEDLTNDNDEWTMEAYAIDARVTRGYLKANTPVEMAGTREDNNPEKGADNTASRAMMYIR